MKAAASVSTDIHVVMGVSASGKSTVGRLLAQARGARRVNAPALSSAVLKEFHT